jgi:hypothetical protein
VQGTSSQFEPVTRLALLSGDTVIDIQMSAVSRRTMLRNAALASRVVASMPTVLPLTKPAMLKHQQQPEVEARRQAGPAHRLGVGARALRFSEIVESVLAQELTQPPIERVAHGRRQIGHRDPHLRLSIPFQFAHGHGRACSTRCRFPFLIH